MADTQMLNSNTTRVTRSQTTAAASAARSARIYRLASKNGSRPRRRPPHLDPWYPKRKVNPNPQPRPQRIPPSYSTCRICLEEKSAADFIPWVPPKRYSNYPTPEIPRCCVPHMNPGPSRRNKDPVCKTCIGAYIESRLDMVGARKVDEACLEPGCTTNWGRDAVLRFFPAAGVEKYNLAMMDVWKRELADQLVPCVSETCNAIGLVDSKAPGFPQIACAACKTRMCASCRIPWHADISCADVKAKEINDAMTEEEKVTLKLLQEKDGKRCPNCFIVIEKDGGCNSMWCSGCKTFFDWTTASNAVPGNKKTFVGPPFWLMGQEVHTEESKPVICELDALD